jgi:penicillin-binding protein 2
MFGEDDVVKSHEDRANYLSILIILAFGLIFARLIFLQVYKGDLLYKYSLENRLREEIIRAPRGVITSRDGEILVNNYPRFDVMVTRQYLKDAKTTLKRVSEILALPVDTIEKTIKRNSSQAAYRPITIKKNVSMKEVALIETEGEDLPGIGVEIFVSRENSQGEIGAHVLGYVSEITQDQLQFYSNRDRTSYRLGDHIGQFGIEKEFDKYLRGVNGSEFVEVDALGRKKRYIEKEKIFQGITDIKSIPGHSMTLTLDTEMQRVAHEALKDRVGTAVAMDVSTGEIYAMVSHPSFEPSEFSKGVQKDYWSVLINNPDKPLRDRAIQEHYSPGSAFKPFTAMALLAENVFTEKTSVNCTGGFTLGSKMYHCWKKHGHGTVDLKRAIKESCNSYFQKAALKLDIDSIAKYSKMFGLGTRTGIELPRETSGLIPTEDWKLKRNGKPWQKGETLSCAIGQSYVLVTMMQMVAAYAAIANGGEVLKPYVIKEIKDENGNPVKQGIKKVISVAETNPQHIKAIREGLYDVVNTPGGTAYFHRGNGIEMSGKTGTSQVVASTADKIYQKCELMPYERRHHGLFISYLPEQNPKLAIAVLVEHGCHGSSAAAPVAAKIGETYMKKYQPVLYAENLAKQSKNNSATRVPVPALQVEQEGDLLPDGE